MKNHLTAIIFLIVSASAGAQNTSGGASYTLGYFSPFGVHPGLKAGVELELKAWEVAAEGDKAAKLRSLVLSPQLGYFANNNDYWAGLINAELGYKRQRSGKKGWTMLSVGTGYLNQQKVTTVSTNLAGEKTLTRETRNFVQPSIHATFGRDFSAKLGGYAKLGYGKRFSGSAPDAGMLLLELGLRFSPSGNPAASE